MRIVSVIAVALALTACGGSGSTTSVIARADVEKGIAAKITAQVIGGQAPAPSITCPSDLDKKVGADMQCVLGAKGDKARYGVTVVITALTNGTPTYAVQIGTPLP